MSDERLQTEYEQCFDNWRFLVGLRFTVLAFFLTLTSGLLYAALTLPAVFPNRPDQIIMIKVTAIAGLISCLLIIAIERRNKELYDLCVERATQIEKQWYSETKQEPPTLTDKDGLAHQLKSKKASLLRFRWHGIALEFMVFMEWRLLLGFFAI
jgi:hypothetical protein